MNRDFQVPLVSIVIASHNSVKWIESAVESAVQQTYPNLKILVVDDGLEDLSQFLKKYPINYKHLDDRGPVECFNRGVRMSQGDYFIKLDADNALERDYVEKTMKEMLKDERIGFVYTGEQRFGEVKEIRVAKPFNKWGLLRRNYVHSASLVRRKAFDDAGGYDTRLDAADDWDLWITIAFKGWKGKAIDEPLHHYQIHDPLKHTSMGMSRDGNTNAFKMIVQKHRRAYAIFAGQIILGLLKEKAAHPRRRMRPNWMERYIIRSLIGWMLGRHTR